MKALILRISCGMHRLISLLLKLKNKYLKLKRKNGLLLTLIQLMPVLLM